MTEGRDPDAPADPGLDDPADDLPGDAAPASPPSVPEGVRIIGAEEAKAALDTGHASPRKAENEMRFGDVPPRPDPAVRPAARFPAPAGPARSADDTAARPVVPRVAAPSAVAPPVGSDAADDPDVEDSDRPGPGSSHPDDGSRDDSIEVVLHDVVGGDRAGAGDDGDDGGDPDGAPAAPEHAEGPGAEAGDTDAGIGTDVSGPMRLPHWTEPPTGEVPRILPEAEPVDMTDEEDLAAWAALAGGEPRFRSRAGDWDDDEGALVDALGPGLGDDVEELGALADVEPVDDDSVFAEQVARRRRIRTRSAARADLEPPGPAPAPTPADPGGGSLRIEAPDGPVAMPGPADPRHGDLRIEAPGGRTAAPGPAGPRASGTAPDAPPAEERRGRKRPEPDGPPSGPAPQGDALTTRVVTGIAIAVACLVCLKLGAGATVVLAALIVGVAAFEIYDAIRRATFRPAAVLGILGSVGLVFAAYERGEAAFPLITALVVVFTLLWYLIEVVRARPLVNVGATLVGFCYVGVLGGFAGLILSLPHGVGLLLGLAISAVGYDVFGFLVGSQLGRRHLAPAISPNKTVEGLVGGMSAAVILGVVTSSVIGLHPWEPSIGRGLALGAVVAVMAPLGDLCESMIKRDLRVKDLGSILPGHGGVLDRFDAILFCMPAVYYLARHLFG